MLTNAPAAIGSPEPADETPCGAIERAAKKQKSGRRAAPASRKAADQSPALSLPAPVEVTD